MLVPWRVLLCFFILNVPGVSCLMNWILRVEDDKYVFWLM